MKNITETQRVVLFSDDIRTATGEQSVLIDLNDPSEPWLVVSHCGEEFSMSLENWNKLVELAEKAKSKL